MSTTIQTGLFKGLSFAPGTADLAHLAPGFAAKLSTMLNTAKASGITATITQGFRSTADQARIYNSGVRPAAQPGHSFHEFGLAADVYATNPAQQGALISIGQKLGLTNLANIGDAGHFQLGTGSAASAAAQYGSTQGAPYTPGGVFGGDTQHFTGTGSLANYGMPPASAPVGTVGDSVGINSDPFPSTAGQNLNTDAGDSTSSGGMTSQFDGNSGLSHASGAFSTEGGSGFSSGESGSSVGGVTLPGVGNSVSGSTTTGAPDGINSGGIGGTGGPGDGSTGATGVPGLSSQGSGNFASFDSTPASNATSDGTASPAASTASAPASSPVPGISGGSATSGNSTAAAPSASNTGGGGNPVNIVSNQPEINAANAIAKSATGVGTSITSAEGAAAVAGTSWLSSIFSAGTDLFARSGFILLGFLILAGAGLFFYIESQKGSGGTTLVPIPV
jgi:hypothetical protein